MLVRADGHDGSPATVRYRDFWGQDKREQLAAATADPDAGPDYEPLTPEQANWFRLLRWHPAPRLRELAGRQRAVRRGPDARPEREPPVRPDRQRPRAPWPPA